MTGRDRMALLVVLCVALVAGAWFLVLAPQRNESKKLTTDLAAAQTRLSEAQARVTAGRTAQAGRDGDAAVLAQLGSAVPPDTDLPSLITQVQRLARDSKIVFRTLSLSSSGGGQAQTPGPIPAASGATGTSGAAGATANQAALPPAIAATTDLPPGVELDASGLPTLPFDFTFTGRYFDLQLMLGRLADLVQVKQQGLDVRGRLLSVDSFSLAPSSAGLPRMDAAVHAKAYLLPAEQAGTTGASGAAGAAVAVPPATSSALPAPPTAGAQPR